MCRMCGRLGDDRAALGWCRSGPPRRFPGLFGSWPASWFGSVPSSRAVGTGRLFWYPIRQSGHLTAGLRVGRGDEFELWLKSEKRYYLSQFSVFRKFGQNLELTPKRPQISHSLFIKTKPRPALLLFLVAALRSLPWWTSCLCGKIPTVHITIDSTPKLTTITFTSFLHKYPHPD